MSQVQNLDPLTLFHLHLDAYGASAGPQLAEQISFQSNNQGNESQMHTYKG